MSTQIGFVIIVLIVVIGVIVWVTHDHITMKKGTYVLSTVAALLGVIGFLMPIVPSIFANTGLENGTPTSPTLTPAISTPSTTPKDVPNTPTPAATNTPTPAPTPSPTPIQEPEPLSSLSVDYIDEVFTITSAPERDLMLVSDECQALTSNPAGGLEYQLKFLKKEGDWMTIIGAEATGRIYCVTLDDKNRGLFPGLKANTGIITVNDICGIARCREGDEMQWRVNWYEY